MPEYYQNGASIVEPVLRIDRGGLRIASDSNASSGTAGNDFAAASAGIVISGNGSPLATTPLNATHDDGAAQPVNMTIVLKTPSGPVALTVAEFTAQKCAYATLVKCLNAGHSYGVGHYIERFGLL